MRLNTIRLWAHWLNSITVNPRQLPGHKSCTADTRSDWSMSLGFWLILALLVGFSGCATQTAPDKEPEPSVSLPQPTVSTAPIHALSRMLQEARAQVEDRNWQAAIASAERGLRIDRREPELYLLLAKSYRGLAELDRARQFAHQGLRYISDSTRLIAIDLNSLLVGLD